MTVLSVLELVTGLLDIFVLIVVLTLLREMSEYRAKADSIWYLVQNPPPPSFIGSKMPERLCRLLADRGYNSSRVLVVVVSPANGPSKRLVAELSRLIEANDLVSSDVLFIVRALPSSAWGEYVATLPSEFEIDLDGLLTNLCEVRVSPAMFVVDAKDNFRAIDYVGKVDIEWIRNYFVPASNQLLV